MVTGIAGDFNQLLLNISNQAQQALSNEDSRSSQEISAQLKSAMESSRHSHDLIVRMLAYQSAAPSKSGRTDLSETAKHTFSLLRQSIAVGFHIEDRIESDLHAAESDVIELQKLLIQMFQYLCDSLPLINDEANSKLQNARKVENVENVETAPNVLAELKVSDYHEQHCACCQQKIDGQYLELAVSSGQRARAASKTLLYLANEPADDPLLRSRTDALHEQLAAYSGHIMLQDTDTRNLDWRLLIPLKTADNPAQGIRLDNSVQLEKYRQRKRERKR